MQPSLTTRIRLSKYQSSASTASGVEVVVDAAVDTDHLFDDLQWLIAASAPESPPDFFVLHVREDCGEADYQRLAHAVATKQLAGKILLVVSVLRKPSDDVLSDLNSHGVRILLGGIGVHARFSDLIDHSIVGLVFDAGLVSDAAGNPQSASILEAISALALQLGLRTFAKCSRQLELDVAQSCGVDYLTLQGNIKSSPTSALAPSLEDSSRL